MALNEKTIIQFWLFFFWSDIVFGSLDYDCTQLGQNNWQK
jgi:hypothetical protein